MIYVVLAASAIVAGIIQNIAGFGAGIMMMLVLPRFFGMVTAPGLNQAISVGVTIMLAWRYRAYMKPRLLLLPIIFYLIASIGLIWIVPDLDLNLLGIFFGFLLIFLSLYFMFIQKKIHLHPTPVTAAVCGLIGGSMSGLFALGAPAMALYFLACTDNREDYMGNLQFLLAVTNVISLSARVARGIFTPDLLLPCAVGFAAILTGRRIGDHIAGKMNPQAINYFIYFLVAVSGLETLVKHLF